MNKLKLLSFSLFFVPFLVFAQNEDLGNLNKNIEVFKEDTIKPPAVIRNYEKITYDVPQGVVKPQQYDFDTIPVKVAKLEMKIKVRTLNPDALKKLYGNYVKLGFGNYTTPYAEGFFNSKRSDQYVYSLHLKHLSSSKGPVSYARTSENIVGASGTYFLDNLAIDGNLNYLRNRYNYYGFNHEAISDVNEDSLKLVYNVFKAKIAFRNLNNADKLNYKIGIGYHTLKNKPLSENEVFIDYKASYWLNENREASVSGGYAYSNRKDLSGNYGRSLFQINPTYILKFDKYQIRAGLNIAYNTDTVYSKKFHLYPKIEADYYLIKDELAAFAGIGGEMQKNDLYAFAAQNPYLASTVSLVNTNNTFDFFAGIKGNTLERLNYKVKLGYKTYKDLPFFVNSFSDSSKFILVYDNGTSSIFNILGTASYAFTEKFRAGIVANYYNYSLSTVEEAWNRPKVDLSILSTYNLYKKIYFNLDIFYLSGLKGKNLESGALVKMDPVFDLNAKIEYQFSDAFGAFIQANNLLGKKYQRYLYYPVKGINIIAGLSYTF